MAPRLGAEQAVKSHRVEAVRRGGFRLACLHHHRLDRGDDHRYRLFVGGYLAAVLIVLTQIG
jgi:hypothetical protein